MNTFLESAIKQFEYYRRLGEKTFAQLKDGQIHVKPSEESNSIYIIIKHLNGNMLSRFQDFLTSDGEKPWRNRDDEFEVFDNDSNYLGLWNEGWDLLLATLKSLTVDDLERTVYIRNEGHSVYEAINRQLCHYAYHVGQIVFIGKLLVNEEWKSLSIPKNKSQDYNTLKFSREKTNRHFTDHADEDIL
ncbi:DUF1572 family protein [Polluticaenibacter yanchengensis]|uniref:DUF1572 family protein n=1 Tax=Polluticaenibacter yanchengensis TaxID=3014562 RepID=A0ABT4UKX6_9BACT|nr:DUF1572 family protein [Chitinophagaceae bacterium LY-5]